MTPLRGLQKYSRGALWFATMLFVTGLALTLRYWTQSRPWWFFALVAPLILSLNFTLFFVTPRLVLDLPFRWVDLVPGAAICTLVSIVVNAVSVLLMRNWLGAYSQAYGGFGVALAFLSWIGILATFWVWIAAVSGVYWERKAGAQRVADMEDLSAREATSS